MKKMIQTGMKMTELFWRLSPPHSSPSQFLVLILTSLAPPPFHPIIIHPVWPMKVRQSRTIPGVRGVRADGWTPPKRVPQQVCGDRDGLSTIGKSRSCSFSSLASCMRVRWGGRARWAEPQSRCAWSCRFCSTHYCNKWGAAFQAEIKEPVFSAGLHSTIGYPDEWARLSGGISRWKGSFHRLKVGHLRP